MEDPTPVSPFHQELAALHHRVADLEAALTVQQHDAQALRDAQEYAEKIVETIRDPLLVLTADLRVRVANPAFYHTFQVRPAETEGQLIYQLDHGQWDIPALRTLLEELLPHNTVFNDYEVTQTFERIGPRTMLLNARRLDAVQLILLAMEDITARKQTERRLQQEMAERQRLERDAQRVAHFALLGRLAGGLSHELRNPLAVIVLHVDLLEEELRQPSPDSATEIALALTEIKAHLARVDDLVEDYLSLVRGSTLQQTPMELSLLVTQCAHEILPALAAHGITLRLDAVDQLGMVALHPHSFRRVLVNLVHNAVDAMPQGGTLTLQGRRQAATVSLAVQDTGSGIPPEHLPQIFEPLHTTKPGGTGLGLYIVHEVVAAHGGQVAVQSTVGAGTTFTLTLPLVGHEGKRTDSSEITVS
jgi:two-component system CheB/CheR fusion protein